MGSRSLLQGVFLVQGSNLGLLHCRQILYHLSHQPTRVTLLLEGSDDNLSESSMLLPAFPCTLGVFSIQRRVER